MRYDGLLNKVRAAARDHADKRATQTSIQASGLRGKPPGGLSRPAGSAVRSPRIEYVVYYRFLCSELSARQSGDSDRRVLCCNSM